MCALNNQVMSRGGHHQLRVVNCTVAKLSPGGKMFVCHFPLKNRKKVPKRALNELRHAALRRKAVSTVGYGQQMVRSH